MHTWEWDRHRFYHLYNLNTRIVLIMTFLLLVFGTVLIAVFEWNHAFAGMSVADKWTQAFFNATCPRTAGFTSVDLASLGVQSVLVYIFLMWVGGAAQSTGGWYQGECVCVVVFESGCCVARYGASGGIWPLNCLTIPFAVPMRR